MNTRLSLQNFERTRGRCRRDADGIIFPGWVIAATVEFVEMQMCLDTPLRANDELTVELYGNGVRAVFKAVAAAARPGATEREIIVKLAPAGAIRYLELSEEARSKVQGIRATLFTDQGDIEGDVHDLSAHGIGAVLPVAVPTGSLVTIEIVPCRSGPLRVLAEIRYCRAQEQGYRVGFRVASLGRLEQARWNQMLDTEGEFLAA